MVSKPHGGKLVNRVIKGRRREALQSQANEFPSINIDKSILSDLYNIAVGSYSPLEGFNTKEELDFILDHMRLPDDTPWTIPIVFDTKHETIKELREGDDVILRYEGKPVALLRIEEVYTWDKKRYAEKVYGTLDPGHPGVMKTMNRKEYLIGGKIDLIGEIERPFPDLMLEPIETRILFRERGWRNIVAFQTRNVPHRGHEYVQKAALTFTDGLLIHPLVGWKKPGDYRDEVIVNAYKALIQHYYPKDTVVLSVLWMEMRYAGPREAIHHAIVRKNYGCTHFIVGRDHAGVGDYYGPYEAWDLFKEFPDLGITPLFIRESFYCKKCGGMVNEKICPHSDEYRIRISGTRLRRMILRGERPPETMMRPEVAEVVLSYDNPFVE
ncbi:MAG: sulfate adenylyltransferase [Desulfurococcales archaeon]|nr:sulfate adenylyltransferase [Desulfurococcales archaeon]